MKFHMKITLMTAVFSLPEISPHAHTQILHAWQAFCAVLMLNCGTAGSLLGLEKNLLWNKWESFH